LKTYKETDDEQDFEKQEFSKLIKYLRNLSSHKLSPDFDKNFYKKLEYSKPKLNLKRILSLIFTVRKGDIILTWFPALLRYRLISGITAGVVIVAVVVFYIKTQVSRHKNQEQITNTRIKETRHKTQDTFNKTQDTRHKYQDEKTQKINENKDREIINKEFDDVIYAEIVEPSVKEYRGYKEHKEYIPGNLTEGESFTGDIKDGTGTYTWKDGTIYAGEFKEGKISGKGLMNYTNGNEYDGEWLNNERNGKGTFKMKNKTRFSGEWKDDELNGQAKLIKSNGESYSGEWKDGMAHGKGKYTWANGDSYEGEWKFGKMHGKGTLIKANRK
jgi:hypothetical protein